MLELIWSEFDKLIVDTSPCTIDATLFFEFFYVKNIGILDARIRSSYQWNVLFFLMHFLRCSPSVHCRFGWHNLRYFFSLVLRIELASISFGWHSITVQKAIRLDSVSHSSYLWFSSSISTECWFSSWKGFAECFDVSNIHSLDSSPSLSWLPCELLIYWFCELRTPRNQHSKFGSRRICLNHTLDSGLEFSLFFFINFRLERIPLWDKWYWGLPHLSF